MVAVSPRVGPSVMRARAQAVAVVLTAACVSCAVASREPRTTLSDGPVGTVAFRTYMPSSQRPLITRSYLDQPSTVITGVLSLPASTPLQRDGRSPAVILAHGTGGVSDEREHAWARRLNSWGIAAFIVDSYGGRGITPPIYADNPRFTHFAAHLLDAYLGLQLLSTHPKVDGSRVALMGFSRGGEVALSAIFERFRAAAVGAAPSRFAAYIPVYPYCNLRHVGASLVSAPMLMLLGGADDMTEPGPCERAAAWLKGRGVPVRVVVYPGAHHGFDRMRPVVFDRAYVGITKCEAEYNVDTFAVRRLDTGTLLATEASYAAWRRDCRRRGGHVGGDAAARAASIGEVQRFLSDVFAR